MISFHLSIESVSSLDAVFRCFFCHCF
jgi:hypothetical protein